MGGRGNFRCSLALKISGHMNLRGCRTNLIDMCLTALATSFCQVRLNSILISFADHVLFMYYSADVAVPAEIIGPLSSGY